MASAASIAHPGSTVPQTLAPTVPDTAAPAEGARAHLESLLRARKLDRTLTNSRPADESLDRGMPWHVPELDSALHGGLKRGHLSEIVGPASSGRTTLACRWLAAATARGEHAALIDTFDRFDVASGAACGIVLDQLLWVRGQALSKTGGAIDPAWLPGVRAVSGPGTMLERTIDRALKALNLVLQSRVCTAVVLDLADVSPAALRCIPASTWLRLQRVIEGSDTACLLLVAAPTARSAGGITIDTGAERAQSTRHTSRAFDASWPASSEPSASSAALVSESSASSASSAQSAAWIGHHDRARRLAGLHVAARLMSPRRSATTRVFLAAHMDPVL